MNNQFLNLFTVKGKYLFVQLIRYNILLFALFFFNSCEKDYNTYTSESTQQKRLTKTIDTKEEIKNIKSFLVLGERQPVPFEISNMRKAAKIYMKNNNMSESFLEEFRVNSKYLKFIPKNKEDLSFLTKHNGLDLHDYPMDYKIKVRGNYYRDPEIPESLPTYQYAVISANQKTPDKVKYEVIHDLFMQENYEGKLDQSILDEVEDIAFEISNYNSEEFKLGSEEENFKLGPKWWPKGNVKVQEALDDMTVNGDSPTFSGILLPVMRVKVKAKRGLRVRSDYTDNSGNFNLGWFKGKVDYKIEFESERVKITNWWGFSRNHNGPNNQLTDWYPIFNYWNEDWAYATCHNGVEVIRQALLSENLQYPFPNTVWAGGEAVNKLNVQVKIDGGTGRYHGLPPNPIKIWSDFSNGIHKSTGFLYRVIFHEVGHYYHFHVDWPRAATSGKLIRESLADFIEHYFIRDIYPQHSWHSSKQFNNFTDMEDGYTPLFIDIEDNINQLTILGGNKPDDNVANYSINQIEDCIDNCNNLNCIEDYLRDQYINNTELNLDDLFDFYEGI